MVVVNSVRCCWEVKEDEDWNMVIWFSYMEVIRCIGLVEVEVTVKLVEECIKNKRNWESKYIKFYKS